MARPKKVNYSPEERLRLRLEAGLSTPAPEPPAVAADADVLGDLPSRLRAILGLVRDPAKSSTDMLYLVMYDISDDRVRLQIAKYLLSKGCIRVQKSVYLAKTHRKTFAEINEALAEVQAAYDNEDSILLIPVQAATVGSMKIIGKDIQIQSLVDPPNTLFY